ncbi:MAG: hypothetical protein ONB46_16175 [candidate division KSB1 bacterium]|nr:hypothetical protein [candidate division KSB1 bacterium]MDZ7367306.1 hypothetical protein [candidate division KSB1 bacterium]MDZ7405855.1 hypothetical protein [candidate division KSB1 bacterium]
MPYFYLLVEKFDCGYGRAMHDLLQIFLSLTLSLNQKPASNSASPPVSRGIVAAGPAVSNARLYEMSKMEIDALLRKTSARLADFPSRLQAYSPIRSARWARLRAGFRWAKAGSLNMTGAPSPI